MAVQTSALPLSAQEPMNNIVRSCIQTLAAVLAGTQSIHTTAYDEAYCLPTEEAQKLAIRTQQVIAYETGVMKSVDPLGGSYLVETLTNEIEERIWELMKVIEGKGGFIRCFKDGWVEEQLNEARYRMADAIETGEQSIVGVNVFRQEGQDTEIDIFQQAPDMQAKRIDYVRTVQDEPEPGARTKSTRLPVRDCPAPAGGELDGARDGRGHCQGNASGDLRRHAGSMRF